MSPEEKPLVGKSIETRDLLENKGRALKLRIITGKEYLKRPVMVSEVNRPGLALSGHLENYRSERIQIIGRGEHAFCLSGNQAVIKKNLEKMFRGSDTPCVIITSGLSAIPVFKEVCSEHKIPLLRTELESATFIKKLNGYLEDRLAPETRLHGVLVNVYGLGVLIQGGAGIGKSECALELVKRGHRLVADDIVELERRRGETLYGSCPTMLKHYMEVRGLGIIDIELLFGVGSIMDGSKVEMEVRLLPADKQTYCDRTGLEQSSSFILGVPIPSISIPVTPGRNLAVLIEVAALNQRLKGQGIFAAKEFNRKLIRNMTAARKDNASKEKNDY